MIIHGKDISKENALISIATFSVEPENRVPYYSYIRSIKYKKYSESGVVTVMPPSHSPVNLNGMTVSDLRSLALSKGITLKSRMKKKDIIEAINTSR